MAAVIRVAPIRVAIQEVFVQVAIQVVTEDMLEEAVDTVVTPVEVMLADMVADTVADMAVVGAGGHGHGGPMIGGMEIRIFLYNGSMSYDVIIIGAGIAGLRTGIQVLTAHPHMKCAILEKYDYKGGRVITYHESVPGISKVQWESGAGRIAHTHKKVLGLMKRYGLHTYPISGDAMYIGDTGMQPNRFSDLHDVFIEPLRRLPPSVLQTHTLAQVSEMVLGAKQTRELYSQFPYFSEIHTLRADHAIYVFDYEMGSMSGFVGCVEGMSAMIDGMVDDFQKLGGSILLKHEVTAISSLQDGTVNIHCKKDTFTAPICVMALPSEAMKSIRGVSHLPVLDRLVMNPLLRMYAVFPVKKGKSWFSGMSKVVTSDPTRFIIPMDPSKGTIMISYTDGNDARYWTKKKPAVVEKEVMYRIRSLFPDHDIPDPIFFKTYSWTNGCTYWKPGHYDLFEESKRSIHPDPIHLPGLFLCGESFAVLQCWMECAIEQADHMIESPTFQKKVNALKSIVPS